MALRRVAVRMAWLLASLLLASLLIFAATNALPGDLAQVILGTNASPGEAERLRAELGLDRPFLTRYLEWLWGAVRFDFGVSYISGRPIAPLIAAQPEAPLPANARTAVFYSISNCQPGLRGVSLGNFLIKKVVDQLRLELPQLKTFCTLSPVPGLAHWLAKAPPAEGPWAGARERAAAWIAQQGTPTAESLQHMDKALQADFASLCAHYLVHQSHAPLADPVARFHLDNGARLERINFAADLSRKGLKQSFGLMVNYLYEVTELEARHEQFAEKKVSHSSTVKRLLKPAA